MNFKVDKLPNGRYKIMVQYDYTSSEGTRAKGEFVEYNKREYKTKAEADAAIFYITFLKGKQYNNVG